MVETLFSCPDHCTRDARDTLLRGSVPHLRVSAAGGSSKRRQEQGKHCGQQTLPSKRGTAQGIWLSFTVLSLAGASCQEHEPTAYSVETQINGCAAQHTEAAFLSSAQSKGMLGMCKSCERSIGMTLKADPWCPCF